MAETSDRGVRGEFPRGSLADGPRLPDAISPLRWRFRRARPWLAAIVVLAATLGTFHRPILVGVAYLFRVDDPAPSDAMVILLGGPECRPARGAELYRLGMAPRVVLAGSRASGTLPKSETDLAIEEMRNRGVPASAVAVLPGVPTSTREEALLIRSYVEANGVRRLLIVTTAFHTARARWIIRKALAGLPVEVRVAAARHPSYNEGDWYTTDEGIIAYLTEAAKTLVYRLRY